MKTTTKDEAGKEATWNEEFILENIEKSINAKETLVLEALDANAFIDNVIGTSKPIDYNTLMIQGHQ